MTNLSNYVEFLESKAQLSNSGGFEPDNLPNHLFDYQTSIVEWAVRKGRGGIFADCGLGKTPMSLAWAEQINHRTGRPVLFLTPLAVGFQIADDATKFGHDAALSRNGTILAPITITNYEQLANGRPTQRSSSSSFKRGVARTSSVRRRPQKRW